MIQYVKDTNGKASINTSDWGASTGSNLLSNNI